MARNGQCHPLSYPLGLSVRNDDSGEENYGKPMQLYISVSFFFSFFLFFFFFSEPEYQLDTQAFQLKRTSLSIQVSPRVEGKRRRRISPRQRGPLSDMFLFPRRIEEDPASPRIEPNEFRPLRLIHVGPRRRYFGRRNCSTKF